jgi:hypothetical protein
VARPWPGAGFGPRGDRGLGRPPAGGREAPQRTGPVRSHDDWFVERDALQKRSGEDGAGRLFEGRRGLGRLMEGAVFVGAEVCAATSEEVAGA